MSRGLVDASVLAPPRLCECGCERPVKQSGKRFASRMCANRRQQRGPRPRPCGFVVRPEAGRTLLPGLALILKHLQWANRRLAERTGYEPSSVTMWLQGKAAPTLGRLLAICRLLHCTPNELTGHDPLTPERLAAIAAAVEAK